MQPGSGRTAAWTWCGSRGGTKGEGQPEPRATSPGQSRCCRVGGACPVCSAGSAPPPRAPSPAGVPPPPPCTQRGCRAVTSPSSRPLAPRQAPAVWSSCDRVCSCEGPPGARPAPGESGPLPAPPLHPWAPAADVTSRRALSRAGRVRGRLEGCSGPCPETGRGRAPRGGHKADGQTPTRRAQPAPCTREAPAVQAVLRRRCPSHRCVWIGWAPCFAPGKGILLAEAPGTSPAQSTDEGRPSLEPDPSRLCVLGKITQPL